MDPHFLALVVFACVCGSAAFGLLFDLPERHRNAETKEVVRLGTGLIGTIAALVLGLLISSAQANFDRITEEMMETSAGVLMLDRALAEYGPDAKDLREHLKVSYAKRIELLFSRKARQQARVDGHHSMAKEQDLDTRIRLLTPSDPFHEALQAHALELLADIEIKRALMHVQAEGSLPRELLIVLVSWLVVIFATFGLFAPRNSTVWTALMVCAVSTSAAMFLILELNTPFTGLVTMSPLPMQETLERLGR